MNRKLKLLLSLVVVLLFTANIFSQNKHRLGDGYKFPVLPKTDPAKMGMYSVIKDDFTLTLRDNVILDCSRFYPSEHNLNWTNGYPCVLMCHGYGDRKETLEQFAHDQAGYGYVVYTYSMRGQGNSGGLSNLISTTEALDLIEMTNYMKRDTIPWLDSTKILIMGGSQGALVPYMAACNGMQVNSIISALGSPEFASSWIENGSIKMSFLWTIDYTPDTARYTPQVDRMSDWVYSTGLKSDKWDSLAYYVPLNRDFKNQVSNNTVPLLIENSWQDYFFNAKQSLEGLPFLQPFYRTYFGAVVGHGGDVSEAENTWHMNFFNEWFYYYLWGIDNGIISRTKYQIAYTSSPKLSNGMWSFVHDSTTTIPGTGTTNMKLYFNNNNTLTTTQLTNNTTTKSFKNDIRNNYTLQSAVYDEFKGTTFTNNFKVNSIYFQSTALTSDLKLLGTPSINLDYTASANICQYNFQIFEVFPNNSMYLVSRVNYTDRSYTANQRKAKLITGNTHGHIFKSGSKIRIVATNLDRTPSDTAFLALNPFVLPVMKTSTNKIYLRNTFINIPVKTAQASPLSFFEEEVNSMPEKTELFQNYPNPFNPTTSIKFMVPENYSGIVTLKVYDLVGREVATLVNQNMKSGTFEVMWNASNYSSGVYFYKITAGNYSDVKRMMLVK